VRHNTAKVNGEFLGRLWYISERSLNEYIDDQIAARRRSEETSSNQ
jgi:hypothetical protein